MLQHARLRDDGLLLPAILVIVDDLVAALHWLWFGMDRPTRAGLRPDSTGDDER